MGSICLFQQHSIILYKLQYLICIGKISTIFSILYINFIQIHRQSWKYYEDQLFVRKMSNFPWICFQLNEAYDDEVLPILSKQFCKVTQKYSFPFILAL